MTDIELIGKLELRWYSLDGEIVAKTRENFIKQFRNICSCPQAMNVRGIVYIWSTSIGIPRLKGESNIVYIGQTSSSMYERNYKYAEREGSGYNWERYKYIIEKYGPIKFRCAKTEKPKEAEKKLLNWYFEEHLELPPANRRVER